MRVPSLKPFTASALRQLSADMLDFSPCLGFLERKAGARRRLKMDAYKDSNQLLAFVVNIRKK